MERDHELNGSCVVDPELLLQRLGSGCNVLIVDVRTTAEFHAGHIPGSRLIPIHHLAARSSEIAAHRCEPVVLVSRGETRARVAAGALRVAGFSEVAVLAGGIRRWRELGFPIEGAAPTSSADAAHQR